MVVCRRRQLLDAGVLVREMVISKRRGLIRDVTYFARLFQLKELAVLLTDSGFNQISCAGKVVSHPKPEDYGLLGKRMLVTAEKP